ncbi:MAG: T9SS type A sorting domain-containing protein [Flavobacteriales bacterium]|nr:T9SS type A sorting domain-containing protein [Flavobacteriales bacterium]
MNKILLFAISLAFFTSCTQTNNKQAYFASDNPAERVVWERIRLADPNTGEIPNNIRQKEIIFAKTLPKSTSFNKASWLHRGPYNVGGRTRALAMDMLDENILFAGGASGGMFRSTDGGQSWVMTTDPNQLHNVTCVSQDKRAGKENIWYFGSGELTGSSASGGEAYYGGNGIYKSVDGGLSWDSLSVTATNTNGFDSNFDFIWNIETDPSNDSLDVVYAATYGTIYRSENGGATWVKELGGGSTYYNNIEVTSSGEVYATLSSDGLDKGIWHSVDGQNWTNITDSLFPPIYGRIAIGVNPSNEDEVYFLAAETDNHGQHTDVFFNGETWTSFWKYDSSDSSWVNLSSNIPANQSTSFDNFNAQGGYDLLVKVHPTDPNTVYIGGTNLWRSSDGFTTPNNTMIIGGYFIGSVEGDGNWGVYPNHHPDQHDLLFLPSDANVILSATDGGVFKSNDTFADTVEWTSLNNGYYTSQLYGVSISRNANSDVMHGGFQDNGNFVTFDPSVQAIWNMPFNGDGCFGGIADNEEDFYLTIQRGVMYKMKLDNNGERLAFNRMDPVSVDSNDYMFINPLVMDKNSDILYMAAGNKLWRNNDIANVPYNNSHAKNDFGWEMFSDTIPNPTMIITTIETSVNPENVVYLGTKYKKIFRIDNAHAGDPSIVELPYPLTASNSYVYDIAVNPDNADEVMIVYSNYSVYSLFHSMDGGQSWNKIAGNLEQNPSGSGNGPSCRTAKIIPLGNSTLYLVGTSVGLFGTATLDDNNTVWEQVGATEIGAVVVEFLEYRENDGLLVVATHGNGIYQTNLTSIGDVLSTDNITADVNLKVFPNPVVDRVSLAITLDKIADAKVIIYDELGRKVGQDHGKKLYFGTNVIQLNIADYKSGIYFVSLTIDNKSITKQIIKK